MAGKVDYQSLLNLLRTREEALGLVRVFEQIESDLYKTTPDFDTTLANRIGSRFYEPLQEIIRQSKIEITQRNQVDSFFAEIISEIQHLPVVHITFAFDPTYLLLTEIVQFLRKNVSSGAILEVVIDKNIIGGFLMDFEGHYWDCSIRSSFEKLSFGGNLIYLVNRNSV